MRPARSPYEVLGVASDATADDIRRAFRATAHMHPDRHPDDPDATARYAEITEAHAILSDETKRGQYDRGEEPYDFDATTTPAAEVIPPDVAAIFEFAQEAVPEAIAAVQAAATDEPWTERLGRAGSSLVGLAREKARTPEGQTQIRAVAKMAWDFALGLMAPKPP